MSHPDKEECPYQSNYYCHNTFSKGVYFKTNHHYSDFVFSIIKFHCSPSHLITFETLERKGNLEGRVPNPMKGYIDD